MILAAQLGNLAALFGMPSRKNLVEPYRDLRRNRNRYVEGSALPVSDNVIASRLVFGRFVNIDGKLFKHTPSQNMGPSGVIIPLTQVSSTAFFCLAAGQS